MLTALIQRLRLFRDDTRGYITVEAMIVLPALLWLFGVGWVYFDVFRQQTISQKANYALGDMISQQTSPLSEGYIDNAQELFMLLTGGDAGETGMRITVASYDLETDSWSTEWSRARGRTTAGVTGDLAELRSRLPAAMDGDQLVLIETWDLYDPIFDVGLDEFDITTYSFTRPRYAPRILLEADVQGGGSA